MASPAISVAMSVYNGERFLAEAIESILAQTFGDFEFLIVDDGSRDSSRAIIEAYAAKDERIRPILRENRGLIASLNQLIRESRAPVVARMDDDDISHPERFAKQMAFLNANPDHGVIGAWSVDIDEQGRTIEARDVRHPVTHEAILQAIEADTALLCHPVVTYRRDVVLAAGGYHAAYRHVEDQDLWLRLASSTKLANLPERLICYRRSPDQVSSRHATEQQIGHAVAMLAYHERAAGRPDPTAELEALPPLGEFDALFGREGMDRAIRARLARSLQYSQIGLSGSGFDHVLQHVREGGSHEGLWRTVARLLRFGEPKRALRLAAALAGPQ